MLFPGLVLVFPSAVLAARLPIISGQAVNQDDCTTTTTLAPVTFTSVSPASTIGATGASQGTSGGSGSGSLIYTTALPTLGPDGLGMHTYTVTVPCPGTPGSSCNPLDSSECPPGFTTTSVVCNVCGPTVVTTVLTLPVETAGSSGTSGVQPPHTSANGETKQVTKTCDEELCQLDSETTGYSDGSSATSAPTTTKTSSGAGSGSGSGSSIPNPAVNSSEYSSSSSTAGATGDSQGNNGAPAASSVLNTFSTQGSSTIASEETPTASPSVVQVAGSGAMFVDMRALFGALSFSCVLAQLLFPLN